MALAIRLSRGGRKGRPFYRIVVADKRMPRDGRYIEKLGTYNPLLEDNEERVKLVEDRIKYWLSQGAKPSERVAIFLGKAGLAPVPEQSVRPNKSKPGEKQIQLKADKKEKQAAAAEAAKAAEEEAKEAAKAAAEAEKAAPAEEAPAEEAPAPEAEAPAEAAPAEEKPEDKAEDKAPENTEEPAAEAETPAEDKAEEKAAEKPAE